jgi:hypothetical protein
VPEAPRGLRAIEARVPEPGSAGAWPGGAAPLEPAESYGEKQLAMGAFGSAQTASGSEAGLQSRPCLSFVEA